MELNTIYTQDNFDSNSNSDVVLYDTNEFSIKILCIKKYSGNIQCKFLKIESDSTHKWNGVYIRDSVINFQSNYFFGNNCYLTYFKSEYFFCCGINNYIQCFKISEDTYTVNNYK